MKLTKVQVNSGRDDAITDVSKVENKYNAKWVGQFPMRTRDGSFSESPADVYYQETPPVEGYSNYFGLIFQHGSLYITSAEDVPKYVIYAVTAEDGEIIYSRYRHDFRYSTDKTVWIDGGLDYTRCPLVSIIRLVVIDGEFYRVDEK